MKPQIGKKLLASLVTAFALLTSACTANTNSEPGSTSNSPASDTGGAETANPRTPAEIEGRTSTAFGTEGMAPIGKLAESSPSAAELTVDPATDSRWEQYYTQTLNWGQCPNTSYSETECATVKVPLKWNEPEGESIELLINRLPATSGNKQGSILINPGGPGVSGVQMVAIRHESLVGTEVKAQFDLIGFDPRGVQDSAGIKCLDAAQTDAYLANETNSDGSSIDWAQQVADACQQNSGHLLPYLDTLSAARDMDVIRAVLGEPKLDYLGYSYGTFLGATYAELYPERTNRLVLDAPVDPSLTGDEIVAGQAAGLELNLDSYAKWCIDRAESCPLSGDDVAAMKQQIQDFLTELETTPLQTSSGRLLTSSLAASGILIALYGDENWDYLNLALSQAFAGKGEVLLHMSDLANERKEDGTYASNSIFAMQAINCLDTVSVVDENWVETEKERLTKLYPIFGPAIAGPGLDCAKWPAKPVMVPKAFAASGSAPILLIGTTGDMATPYAWAEAVDSQLENSVLLTFKGNGHTANGRSGGCIEAHVDAYFLKGTLPAAGTVCDPLAAE